MPPIIQTNLAFYGAQKLLPLSDLGKCILTSRSEVAIFTSKQTLTLHITGLVMAFKRICLEIRLIKQN